MAILNARSKEEMEAAKTVLSEYFVRMEDGWYQPRMQREIERAESISRARSTAGRKGFQAKAKQLPSKSQAIAKQVPLHPQPQSQPQLLIGSNEPMSGDAAAARRVLQFLNEKAGRNYQPVETNLRMIRARLKEYGESTLMAVVAMKCREWGADERMAEYLRPGTLFNAEKCAQYAGKVGTFTEAK